MTPHKIEPAVTSQVVAIRFATMLVVLMDLYMIATRGKAFLQPDPLAISLSWYASTLVWIAMGRWSTDITMNMVTDFDRQTFNVKMVVGIGLSLLILRVAWCIGYLAHDVYGIVPEAWAAEGPLFV
jgi:hypothetical protein